jgi:thioredoxin 1
MSDLHELSEGDLDTTLQSSDVPVLIDFSATWCQPCKALAPTIEAVAKEYGGRLAVYKVDIDNAPNAAGHFGIHGVPTCIFFKGGKEVDRFSGVQDLRTVKDRVEKVIS